MSPTMTLNAGVRWEPWFPQQHDNGAVYNFTPDRFRAGQRSTVFPGAPPGFTYPGDEGFPNGKAGMHREWLNIAPRVGLAWESSELAMVEKLLQAPVFDARVEPLQAVDFTMRDVYPPTHWAITGRPPAIDGRLATESLRPIGRRPRKTPKGAASIAIRRSEDRKSYEVTHSDPIHVLSTDPAELQRATQAIADALGATIAAAPEQWYSFKPLWPSTVEEQAVLAELDRG